jgi:hypothetical protein
MEVKMRQLALLATFLCYGCLGGSDGSPDQRPDDHTVLVANGGHSKGGNDSDSGGSGNGGSSSDSGGSSSGGSGSSGGSSDTVPNVDGGGQGGSSNTPETTVPDLGIDNFVPVVGAMMGEGYTWTLTNGSTMYREGPLAGIVTLGSSLGCYTGTVGKATTLSAVAGMDINHNDKTEDNYAPPALAVGGIQAKVSQADPSDLDLRLIAISKIRVGELVYWCAKPGSPTDGSTVPWGDFSYGCPESSGIAYANQPIHAVVVGVFGRSGVETPYRFCIDSLKIVQ